MTKKSQRGSIEIILIGLVAILVAIGLYLWYGKTHLKGSVEPVSKTTETPKATPDPTAGWKSFTSTSGKFSLKYPPTWVQPVHQDLCTPSILQNSIYLGPTADTVLHCASSYFGMIGVVSVDGDKSSQYVLGGNYAGSAIGSTYNSSSVQDVKADGVSGKRFSGTVKTSPDGPGSMPVGTKAVLYVFVTNGRTYMAFYTQQPTGNPDVLADFDTMIQKTLKFE